jgi:hypothetical protein
MAPTPVDTQPKAPEQTGEANKGGLSTASIVGIAFFAFFAVALGITFIAYYFHKRSERNKLPPEKRPASYHPFRTNSAKSSLLANAAPSPEDDKSSMFSRDRNSSLSLYVDTDSHDRRHSTDTVSLIPLHVTPAEEDHDPFNRMDSVGSGVSRYSTTSSGGSLGVRQIPVPEEVAERDLGVRPQTRARSTSSASARYYESNSPLESHPQIPKIVTTPSP